MLAKLKGSGRKDWWDCIDVDTGIAFLRQHQHVYIVDGAYMVAYEIGGPWYCKPEYKLLEELIVLSLTGNGEFSRVPAFLEAQAREAGCKLVMAGTALAKSDAALASLYSRSGYRTEAHMLIKEV